MSSYQPEFARSNATKKQLGESTCEFFGFAEWSFSGVQTAFPLDFRLREFKAQTENRLEDGFPSGFPYGFLNRTPLTREEQTTYAKEKSKSGRGQIRGKGGSDPTLFGFQPPKKPWDRSRPFLKPLARVHASELTNYNASRTTNISR
jgi:hypothetical protein